MGDHSGIHNLADEQGTLGTYHAFKALGKQAMKKLQIGSFSKCLIAAILFHRREGFGDLSDSDGIPEAVKLILLWVSYSEGTFTPPALDIYTRKISWKFRLWSHHKHIRRCFKHNAVGMPDRCPRWIQLYKSV